MHRVWRVVAGSLVALLAVAATCAAEPIQLPTGTGSARLAWVRDSDVQLASTSLPGTTDLSRGHGCLVLAVSGQPVQWREVSLPEEASVVAKLLAPNPGARVGGTVRTRDLWAFTPSVEATLLGARVPDSCLRGLAALGALEAQVDSHGRFELGPLPSGRWRLLFKAQYHKGITKEIAIEGKEGTLETGELDLEPIAVTRVRVESELESPPYALRVEEGERKDEQAPWRFVRPRDLEMDTAQTELELATGTHRFTLTKVGTELGFTAEADLQPGEQELVLRPVPFTIEGRVLRGEHGVADVRLLISRRGQKAEVESGIAGAFTLRLWAPDMYLVEAHPPEGDFEAVLLDAREAKEGEVLKRDILLGSRVLSGIVVGAPEGAPLAAADVAVSQEGGGRRYVSSYEAKDDGSFQIYLKDELSVEVYASARGYLPRTVALGKNPAPSPITISLEKGVEVVGQVVGTAGTPVAGALVIGFSPGPDGKRSCSTESDAAGRFVLTCPTGTVVFAVAAGHTLDWVTASEHEVLLRLGAQGPPSPLTILAADGEPAAGAGLAFQKEDGVWIPFDLVFRALTAMGLPGRTAENGGVSLSFLPPGRYGTFLVARTGVVPLGVVLLPTSTPSSFKLPRTPPG